MVKDIGETLGFVLLHGAGLGAWIWDDVREKLSYPVLAVDFPGRGELASVKTDQWTMDHYIQATLDQIRSFSPRKLILVTHSISGVLGLELAERLQDRVIGFLAIGAAIPRGEGSFISSLPIMNRMIMRLILSMAGTKPPETVLRNGLCSDLDEEAAKRVIERFVPEAKRLYTESIKRRGDLLHAGYIRLTEDREFNEQMQARMIANLQPDEVIDLASGHLPMLGRPDELAGILNRYAHSRRL